jgi:mycobactin lysine-N-oxygenase
MPCLLIIGAGPKAISIAAKAKALSECGYSVPEIKIIEKNTVAANWIGGFGYTDGKQALETPPEKDVGFPYSSRIFERDVDRYMFRHYSWQAHFVDRYPDALESYGDDIDRGVRERPVLSDWARYLGWVARECGASIVGGEVTNVVPNAGHWKVQYVSEGTSHSIDGDALVLTGPGTAKTIEGQIPHPRIFDGSSFWNHLNAMADVSSDDEPIAIVGSGGAAASVILGLARTLRRPVPIFVINSESAIFSRGEGYWENRLFSDPDEWKSLPADDRLQFIKRTDRGVFSIASMTFINRLRTVRHLRMEAAHIEVCRQYEREAEGRPVIIDSRKVRLPAQYAIVAVGFDPWWFGKLIQDDAIRALMAHEDNRQILLRHIESDLAFDRSRVPTPKLHVPMLSGFAQGPGFPNLSCLGHLADRILRPYAHKR